MAAPEGNQFWRLGPQPGRPKKFETPEELWAAATEYFEWADANPWYKSEAIKSGESVGKLVQIPTARPYTLQGFRRYIGASEEYWREFKNAKHEEFFGVIDAIETVMYTQKIEGAMVGAFKENIVSRVLGLADKAEVSSSVINVNVTDDGDDS